MSLQIEALSPIMWTIIIAVARDFEGSKEKAQEAVVALTKKYPIYE